MAKTDSNAYTFSYAAIMTLVVAVALAAAATGLKPMQEKSEALDKKKSILMAVLGEDEKKQLNADKLLAEKWYSERITEVVIDESGKKADGVAFDIELKKEYKKKDAATRTLPFYTYKNGNTTRSVLPMHGAGLWDEIWGFMALDKDDNTIKGISFDHKGETPGLGAEIKENKGWVAQFNDKKLLEGNNFVFSVKKGIKDKPNSQVDVISGATITCDGVTDMMKKAYDSYKAYLKTVK